MELWRLVAASVLPPLLIGALGRWRARWAELSLATGFFVAYGLTSGWPRLPPVEASQWLPWTGLALGLLSLWPSRRSRTGLALVLLLALAWGLMKARFGVLALVGGVPAFALVHGLERRQIGARSTRLLALVALLSAVSMGATGSLRLALLALALSAGLAPLTGGVAGVATPLLLGLLAAGVLYSALPWPLALALGLSPLAASLYARRNSPAS